MLDSNRESLTPFVQQGLANLQMADQMQNNHNRIGPKRPRRVPILADTYLEKRDILQVEWWGNFLLERAAGIEPASLAWKAKVLPLHNARPVDSGHIS